MKTAILQMALRTLSIAAMLTVGWPARSDAEGLRRPADADGVRHLRAENTISDLLRHPTFAGFARLLLPWDDRPYDEQTKLSAIGALLPYHSHVDAASAVSALNRLIDDAGQGQTIFFNIYTEAEKRDEPAKAHTGLFFYRGQPGAPFAIIAPGGGFAYVGSVHEGFPYAGEISKAGFNAFVLKYRAGFSGAVATQDLAVAISFVFRNADALGVSTRGYSLWGSSAGARMAASIGSHGVARFGRAELPKPSAVVMAYTAHSDLSSDEPPAFVVVGERDGISPPSVMERRVSALRRLGTAVEYRKFPGVGHGFGLGVGTSAEGWIDDAIRFWRRHQPR
jgi:acetyl esterase/lipase